MATLTFLTALIEKAITFDRGALLALAFFASAWMMQLLNVRIFNLFYLRIVLRASCIILLVMLVAFSAMYLIYPSYLDHVEPSVAILGYQVIVGNSIYPPLTDYSMAGLLYGPLLAEANALALLLPIDGITASKIPGVVAFLCSCALLLKLYKCAHGREYLISAGAFSFFLFFNRAEPQLLFITSIAMMCGTCMISRWPKYLTLGVLMGLAASLKLHGLIYVAAAAVATEPNSLLKPRNWLVVGFGFALAIAIAFTPEAASLSGYLAYLRLAGKHGISERLLLDNFIVYIFLATPIAWAIWIRQDKPSHIRFNWHVWLVLAMEFIIVVVGAKPGAGPHHLIPFIPINAWFYQQLLPAEVKNKDLFPIHLMLLASAISGVYAAMFGIQLLDRNWEKNVSAHHDASILNEQYSHITMGAGSFQNYDATYLRVIFAKNGAKQIDYPSYMDLHHSGVSDQPIYDALEKCNIRYIAMPNNSIPFSLGAGYTNNLLFSERTRGAFARRYKLERSQGFYDLYTCKQ
jgi:hypothetical protein